MIRQRRVDPGNQCRAAAAEAYAIWQIGILLPIYRIAAKRPFYSGVPATPLKCRFAANAAASPAKPVALHRSLALHALSLGKPI